MSQLAENQDEDYGHFLFPSKLLKHTNNHTQGLPKHTRDYSEHSTVCKMHSQVQLHFTARDPLPFTDVETETQWGQWTDQEASSPGSCLPPSRSQCLLSPSTLSLSDVKALLSSLGNPQTQLCLIEMRIRIREI